MKNEAPQAETIPLLRRVICSPAVYTLIGILLVGGLLLRWIQLMGGPAALREWVGPTMPLLTIPVHVVVAVSPFPSDVICIANGSLYGFWFATGLNWLGWWLAALVEYGLGRRARTDFQLEAHTSRLPAWLKRFPTSHPAFLIGSRQIPWLGGHVSTFVPGAAGVSLRRFAWCSAIAIVPGSVVMASIGVGLLRL